jgi:hypothetical protein
MVWDFVTAALQGGPNPIGLVVLRLTPLVLRLTPPIWTLLCLRGDGEHPRLVVPFFQHALSNFPQE